MHTILKISIGIVFLLFSGNSILAQENEVQISGTVIEEETSQPVPYATVVIHDKTSNEIITGTTTDDSGTFNITVPNANFYVEISFMGFKTKTITEFSVSNAKVDLGPIMLSADNQALDEVVVRGEVSKTIFKLDKRVFNVGQDISSTGVSAL